MKRAGRVVEKLRLVSSCRFKLSIRQHASACVSIRQHTHTSAYVSIRQHRPVLLQPRSFPPPPPVAPAYVSIRQHTSADAYVSIPAPCLRLLPLQPRSSPPPPPLAPQCCFPALALAPCTKKKNCLLRQRIFYFCTTVKQEQLEADDLRRAAARPISVVPKPYEVFATKHFPNSISLFLFVCMYACVCLCVCMCVCVCVCCVCVCVYAY